MGKYIVSFIIGAGFVASVASADSLTELKGLENIGSGSSQHSPSQVVILNHIPSQSQDQATESENTSSQDQRYRARSGWGNGASLEALRESRIDKEAKNEQILMEKLETSRMADEKSRLRRLFKIREYNRRRHVEMEEDNYEFGESASDYETTYAPVQVPRLIKVIDTTSVALNGAAIVIPDVPVASSGASSFKAYNSYRDGSFYIKGQLGFGSYDANNSTSALGTASWGLAIGKDLNSRWQAEFGIYKTSYEINDPNAVGVLKNNGFNNGLSNGYNSGYGYNNGYNNNLSVSQSRDLDQYNFSGVLGFKAVKSNGFLGTLRGGVSYVRRDSESSDIRGLQSFKSNTIDGLFGVGLDVEVARNLTVTGTFDYYTNFISDIASTNYDVVDAVEESDYYVLGLGLKLKF